MPTVKRSLVEWWGYEVAVFRRACKEINKHWFWRSMAVATLTLLGLGWAGFVGKHEIWGRILIAIGAFALVILCEFLWRLLCAPSRMAREDKEKLATVEAANQ